LALRFVIAVIIGHNISFFAFILYFVVDFFAGLAVCFVGDIPIICFVGAITAATRTTENIASKFGTKACIETFRFALYFLLTGRNNTWRAFKNDGAYKTKVNYDSHLWFIRG
jgi:hypothetical protein